MLTQALVYIGGSTVLAAWIKVASMFFVSADLISKALN